MMGNCTPEWLYLDFAVQSLGAIFYGIYVTTTAEGVKYLLDDGEPVVFVAENQEYVDKLFAAETDGGRLVDHVIVVDERGMFGYTDDRLKTFEELSVLGREAKSTKSVGYLRELVDMRSTDEISRVSYTSGTTGRPKGAMLSSRNLVWAISALYYSLGNDPSYRDRTISYMPPASPAEVAYSIVLPVLYGSIPHIPETFSARGEAFVEVCPTIVMGFPRMWESYAARAQVDIETGGKVKRFAYHRAMALSKGFYETLWAEEKPSLLMRFGRFLAFHGALKYLLNKYGFRRTRFVITGGAPVSPDVIRLWNTWGVEIQEIYGMTEVGGLATVQMDVFPRPGIAGKPLHGMDIRLGADGEIQLRSPGVFRGYWRKPDATAEAVDVEGFLHTGDIGRILPDGNLKIVDRRGDFIETADGIVVAASEIEHLIKRSPYVREAVLAGAARHHLTVLIEIDVDAVTEWARANRVLYTSFSSLIQSEDIQALIGGVIIGVNGELDQLDLPRVADYRILPKELDPEEGDEVTSTNKVRRRQLTEKFRHLLDEMYAVLEVSTMKDSEK
jgi:long-chain acyl-CoA synthetase